MSGTETPAAAQSPQLDRRQFLKATAGAAGVAAGIGAGSTLPGSPVGRAEALPCGGLCVGAAAVAGAGLVTGWLLRETEVIGADDPPQGLTPDALRQRVQETARTRKSTNASMHVDNSNILDGAKHVAYSDGKLAAIKALNEQKTQSEVIDAATSASNSYLSTIEKNFLKSWTESVLELENLASAVVSHADLVLKNVFPPKTQDGADFGVSDTYEITAVDTTVTLSDGTDFTVSDLDILTPTEDMQMNPTRVNQQDSLARKIRVARSEGPIDYLQYSQWNGIWSQIQSIGTEVSNGLTTWCESVYSEVQAGELDTADLLTARELAELSSEEEGTMNQALRDLMALNIPVDMEREATLSLTESGTTLSGMLGVSGETTLSAGDSIDPAADSLDYYLTYDVSEASGTWDAYNSGVDGGIVTFTSKPHPGVIYRIRTTGSGGATDSDTAGESAEVAAEDFSETDAGGEWTADISSQVETAITSIQSVNFYSQSEETQNETVRLDEPFTIEKFEDTETGEEAESASYEAPTEPETDSNYITQEEWEQREEDYQSLIDKYEESQGGSGGITIPGIGDVGTGGMFGGVVAIAVVLFGAGKLSN